MASVSEEAMVDEIRSWRPLANTRHVLDLEYPEG